jgi:PAS domain S-box-containing protein
MTRGDDFGRTDPDRIEHQESILEAVVETVPQGILVVDEDRNFLTYNEQFVEMWGIPQAVIAEGDDQRALEAVLDSLDQPAEFLDTVEYCYDNPGTRRRDEVLLEDGRVFERFTAPATDEVGTYFGRVWIFQDVTERRQRKTELERYETLVEEAASGVFAQDAAGRYTFVNSHIEDRIGYDREEIIGRRPEMFLPEEDVAEINDGIKEMVVGERDRLTFETVLTAADGEEIPIEGQLALLPPEDEYTGTVGVVRDISDRKERERRLQEQNERLDEFAGMVSHDLRNPLNVANGRLELVRRLSDIENEDVVDHLDAIEHAHDRMTRLIDDLLALTREGGMVEETSPVDLGTLAADSWRNVDTDGATLENRTDARIRGDRGRVQQLLENLFRNAVEHGSTSPRSQARGDAVDHGSTNPRSSSTREDAVEHGGDAVTVTVGDLDDGSGFYVADDGPGIPVEERDEVFESGYSSTPGGTGVGLAIVQEVANAHGWEVSLTESEKGGARFEFAGVEGED